MSIMTDSPIRFPGLFGDWAFTASSTAFHIGGKAIYWYGILIALGVLAALAFCIKQKERYGIKEDDLMDGVLWGVPLAIVGARLYYVLFYLDRFKKEDGSFDWAESVAIWDGGLAIYGGVIAAVLVCLVLSKKRGFKLGALTDLVVMGLLIGQAIGRWGNFMNREAFGAPTDSFLRMGLYNTLTGQTEYYHPTFLYESVWNLCGFVLLHFLSKRRKYDGQIALCYAAWYGLGRCIIEGLRMDSLYWGSFRVSQLLAAASCVAAVTVLLVEAFRPHDPARLAVNRAAAQAAEAAEEIPEASKTPEAEEAAETTESTEAPESDDSAATDSQNT